MRRVSKATRDLSVKMEADDCFQITLLSLIETATNIMVDRAVPNSRRYNRLGAILEQLDKIDETFDGYLPDCWIERSRKFHLSLEALLTQVLKEYQAAYKRG